MAMSTWIVSDGAAGNEKQALSVALGLGLSDLHIQHVRLRGAAHWLAPRFWRASLQALDLHAQFNAAKPTLAIGCGRAAAVALDAIKRVDSTVRTVQILHPRCSLARFDVVLVPEHDHSRGENVIRYCGSLHSLDRAWLEAGRAEKLNPPPSTVVLIGAPTRLAKFDAQQLRTSLASLPFDSLAISTSRRTPPELVEVVVEFVRERRQQLQSPRLWRGEMDGPNPYQAWLSQASHIWVTPDSVNMISEAYASGADVTVLWPSSARGKLKRFIASTHKLRNFDVLGTVCAELRTRLGLRALSCARD
jgi:uncharacterized protein